MTPSDPARRAARRAGTRPGAAGSGSRSRSSPARAPSRRRRARGQCRPIRSTAADRRAEDDAEVGRDPHRGVRRPRAARAGRGRRPSPGRRPLPIEPPITAPRLASPRPSHDVVADEGVREERRRHAAPSRGRSSAGGRRGRRGARPGSRRRGRRPRAIRYAIPSCADDAPSSWIAQIPTYVQPARERRACRRTRRRAAAAAAGRRRRPRRGGKSGRRALTPRGYLRAQAPRWPPSSESKAACSASNASWISPAGRSRRLSSDATILPRRSPAARQALAPFGVSRSRNERPSSGFVDTLDEAELDVARRPEEDGAQREAELARDLGRRDRLAAADDRDECEILGRDRRCPRTRDRPAGPTCGTSRTPRGAATACARLKCGRFDGYHKVAGINRNLAVSSPPDPDPAAGARSRRLVLCCAAGAAA